MSPTPADEIRAAATRLRDLAQAATPGVWTAHLLPANEHHKHPAHWVKTEYDDATTTTTQVIADCPWRQDDADYIAAMHPDVGRALADWLDICADYAATWPGDAQLNSPFQVGGYAVARLINQHQES